MSNHDWLLLTGASKVCQGCACEIGVADQSVVECRQVFHQGCFGCSLCGKPLWQCDPTTSGVFVRQGQLTCSQCYLGRCVGCGAELASDQSYLLVNCGGGGGHECTLKFHRNCVRCKVCSRQIDQLVVDTDNQCYCVADFVAKFWCCFACGKAISSTTLNTNQSNRSLNTSENLQIQYISYECHKFHPTCFVCNFCNKPLEEPSSVPPTSQTTRNLFVLGGKRCCRSCVVDAMSKQT